MAKKRVEGQVGGGFESFLSGVRQCFEGFMVEIDQQSSNGLAEIDQRKMANCQP